MIPVRRDMFLSTFSLLQRSRQLLEPPAELTVSQWCDQHLILSREYAAEPGKYHIAKTPYLVEPADVFVKNKHVRRCILMWASQLGKTQMLTGMFARNVDLAPAPVIWVTPNEKFATSFSRTRIAPLIRDNPKIRNKFSDPAKKDGKSALLEKWFVGGNLFLASAESMADLSGRACKYGIVDEVDRMESNADEGDLVALTANRLTTFWDSQLVLTSTPGLEETSRIASELSASSNGKWHICCPRCDHAQVLSFDRLTADQHPQHICERCGDPSARAQWLASSANTGHWIHERLVDDYGNKITSMGYWMDVLPSPWVDWSTLREEERKAQEAIEKYNDYSLMQTYTNTRKALPWRSGSTEKADPDLLYNSNREDYGDGVEVPQGVKILTAGIDTQDDRLVYTIFGWGAGTECYGIEHGTIWGDSSKNDPQDSNNVWLQLQRLVIDRQFRCWNGATLRTECNFIDWGGHRSREVSQFVRGKAPRVWAIRGKGGKLNETFVISRNNEYRTPVVFISTDAIKSDLIVKLSMTEKGPGYYHFNSSPAAGFDKAYFEEITAEWQEVVTKDGFRKIVWKKAEHQRNEAHDTATYGAAALAWHFRTRNMFEALEKMEDPVGNGDRVREYNLRHEANVEKFSSTGGNPVTQGLQPVRPPQPQPAPSPAVPRQAQKLRGVSHWADKFKKR